MDFIWVLNFDFKFKVQLVRMCFKLNNYKCDLKPKNVKSSLNFKGCQSHVRSLESLNVFIAEKYVRYLCRYAVECSMYNFHYGKK